MSQNIHTSPELQTVAKEIAPYLEEGIVYYFVNTKTQKGLTGEKMFEIKDGIKKRDERSETAEIVEKLYAITRTLPPNTPIEYTLRKGQPVTVKICTPEMLLKKMQLDIKTHMAGFSKVVSVGEFANGQLIAITEAWHTNDGKLEKQEWSYIVDVLNVFVMSTNPEITAMCVQIEGDTFTVQSVPAIPGLTTQYVAEPENLDLDSNDLAAIYTFLESFSEAKKTLAMQALKNNQEFYQKAEQRYLNFIRFRLNDPNAGLEGFEEAALKKEEVKWFLGRNFQNGAISFALFYDHESRLVIDFIGSMVKNAINIEDYVAKAKALSSEEELVKLYDAAAKDVKKKIVKEGSVSAEGWFGDIVRHLINLKLKKIFLNKTDIEMASMSPVMKEFMFFLNINCKKSIHIDVFQSEVPLFTEMFWMLRAVPDTVWGDVSKRIPDSPLTFKRAGRYDLGEGNGWEAVVKP